MVEQFGGVFFFPNFGEFFLFPRKKVLRGGNGGGGGVKKKQNFAFQISHVTIGWVGPTRLSDYQFE